MSIWYYAAEVGLLMSLGAGFCLIALGLLLSAMHSGANEDN